jgi:hypothetical protein
MGEGAIHPSEQADGGSDAGVVLPLLVVGGREWDNDSIDCGIDVFVERYNYFAFAAGSWRYAGGCDGRADGMYACTV